MEYGNRFNIVSLTGLYFSCKQVVTKLVGTSTRLTEDAALSHVVSFPLIPEPKGVRLLT